MIPFLDLQAQYRTIKPEIEAAIARVLGSGQYVLGEEVAAFEQEFAAYSGAAEGVAVNSGTSALHLALLAAGVGRGDEVITVPMTFVATVAAIGYTDARPVFVDIDPRTYTIDVDRLAAAITPRTKAILPVHLYGQPADMDPILELAERHGLTVIEDACQAHGAEYRGRRVGGLGDFGCFSFYPGKNLGAYGEGGIVLTNDAARARRLRMLRDWGQSRKYHHELPGYNYRMDGLQGSILRVKLRHLEAWTEARRARAAAYGELLREVGWSGPAERSGVRHVYHVYAVRTPRRRAVIDELARRGVQTGIHYPIPVHLQPAHADLGYAPGRFPVAEAVARQELSLPLFPELTAAQQSEVVGALGEIACERKLAG